MIGTARTSKGSTRTTVDAVDRRIRRKSGPVEDDELEPVGELTLGGQGSATSHDAPVDEHDPLHRAIVTCCNEVGWISFRQALFGCYKHADMLLPG
jgi:hypothetical protein